ncbi:hypothetical protein K5I29_12135 [Flavobacterium agricola]|uniref:Signal peptidase n=1 Tax=Flavobacterium agricola TaxID=2870839 RepID=A0ABY6LYW1_9FLAO|nr:hypothetical protein [Flavobacterium agricola]UYW01187.1 hypothetical protein K5I29_12135 [Flavobacterium agricola]
MKKIFLFLLITPISLFAQPAPPPPMEEFDPPGPGEDTFIDNPYFMLFALVVVSVSVLLYLRKLKEVK